METLFIVIMLFIILDIASLRWGFDSTEKIDSPEWARRADWDASYRKREVETDERKLLIRSWRLRELSLGVSASRADTWTSRVGCADSWSTSAFPRSDSALSFVSQQGDKTSECARALEKSAGERGEDKGKECILVPS